MNRIDKTFVLLFLFIFLTESVGESDNGEEADLQISTSDLTTEKIIEKLPKPSKKFDLFEMIQKNDFTKFLIHVHKICVVLQEYIDNVIKYLPEEIDENIIDLDFLPPTLTYMFKTREYLTLTRRIARMIEKLIENRFLRERAFNRNWSTGRLFTGAVAPSLNFVARFIPEIGFSRCYMEVFHPNSSLYLFPSELATDAVKVIRESMSILGLNPGGRSFRSIIPILGRRLKRQIDMNEINFENNFLDELDEIDKNSFNIYQPQHPFIRRQFEKATEQSIQTNTFEFNKDNLENEIFEKDIRTTNNVVEINKAQKLERKPIDLNTLNIVYVEPNIVINHADNGNSNQSLINSEVMTTTINPNVTTPKSVKRKPYIWNGINLETLQPYIPDEEDELNSVEGIEITKKLEEKPAKYNDVIVEIVYPAKVEEVSKNMDFLPTHSELVGKTQKESSAMNLELDNIDKVSQSNIRDEFLDGKNIENQIINSAELSPLDWNLVEEEIIIYPDEPPIEIIVAEEILIPLEEVPVLIEETHLINIEQEHPRVVQTTQKSILLERIHKEPSFEFINHETANINKTLLLNITKEKEFHKNIRWNGLHFEHNKHIAVKLADKLPFVTKNETETNSTQTLIKPSIEVVITFNKTKHVPKIKKYKKIKTTATPLEIEIVTTATTDIETTTTTVRPTTSMTTTTTTVAPKTTSTKTTTTTHQTTKTSTRTTTPRPETTTERNDEIPPGVRCFVMYGLENILRITAFILGG